MICKECGNEIMPGTMFCTNCGAKADVATQDADSDKTVVLWDEEPQQPKQDDDKTVVLWDEEPQQPKQDDDRTVVLWDEEPQQPAPNNDVPKTCPNCGTNNAGDALFCVECGAKKPEVGWTCSCGTVNKGKFCMECGAKKPAGVPQYKCDKCGWEPADKTKPPRFCPECGDPFDNNDLI